MNKTQDGKYKNVLVFFPHSLHIDSETAFKSGATTPPGCADVGVDEDDSLAHSSLDLESTNTLSAAAVVPPPPVAAAVEKPEPPLELEATDQTTEPLPPEPGLVVQPPVGFGDSPEHCPKNGAATAEGCVGEVSDSNEGSADLRRLPGYRSPLPEEKEEEVLVTAQSLDTPEEILSQRQQNRAQQEVASAVRT